MIARVLLVLLLLTGAARAQEASAPRSFALRLGILPGYRHTLGSDWLGTSAELAWGGQAKDGFAVLARLGLFTGASTFRVPFQDWSIAVVFTIPTHTRLSIDVGQSFGMFVIEEPHTFDGYAVSPTLGLFLAPTVDLWRRGTARLFAEARVSYDWIPADATESSDPGNSITFQLGIGLAL